MNSAHAMDQEQQNCRYLIYSPEEEQDVQLWTNAPDKKFAVYRRDARAMNRFFDTGYIPDDHSLEDFSLRLFTYHKACLLDILAGAMYSERYHLFQNDPSAKEKLHRASITSHYIFIKSIVEEKLVTLFCSQYRSFILEGHDMEYMFNIIRLVLIPELMCNAIMSVQHLHSKIEGWKKLNEIAFTQLSLRNAGQALGDEESQFRSMENEVNNFYTDFIANYQKQVTEAPLGHGSSG